MKICVIGLWHLGTVIAACLAAQGHDVYAIDDDGSVIEALNKGKAPISEPGLDDLVEDGLKAGKLRFSSDYSLVSNCDVTWLTVDTPVDANDEADLDFARAKINAALPHVADNTAFFISAQVPVGFTSEIAKICQTQFNKKQVKFVYSPENLRLGKAIACMTKADRVIIGSDTDEGLEIAKEIFKPFTNNFLCMSLESAEMAKHALNAFLGLSVTFINEIATICELVGANAADVARSLKSEERIGPKAYLNPGAAFAGGTLARDVAILVNVSESMQKTMPLLKSIRASNEAHKLWAQNRIQRTIKNLKGQTIAVLGLAYKPGTDTLRRSAAVELCKWLAEQGAVVNAYDPAVHALPESLDKIISLKDSIALTLGDANAVVLANECPEFRAISAQDIVSATKNAVVFDASGYLRSALENESRINYISVGKP